MQAVQNLKSLINEVNYFVNTFKHLKKPLYIGEHSSIPDTNNYKNNYVFFLIAKHGDSFQWYLNLQLFNTVLDKLIFDNNYTISSNLKLLIMEKFKIESMLVFETYTLDYKIEVTDEWLNEHFGLEPSPLKTKNKPSTINSKHDVKFREFLEVLVN